MSDCFSELRALVQGVTPRAKWIHCLIQREALISQQLGSDLTEVLEIVVKIVNFIKTRLLEARLFQCFAINSKPNTIIYCFTVIQMAFYRQGSFSCVRIKK